MIRHFKINQSNLSNTSQYMRQQGTNGVNGYIVTEDSRRIYYQGKGVDTVPVKIGTSDYWVIDSSGGTNGPTLQFDVGKKYVRSSTRGSYNLPRTEFALAVGDTVEFYNNDPSPFYISDNDVITPHALIEQNENKSGQYYKFYWTGTSWQVMQSGIDSRTDRIISSLNQHWDYDTNISGIIYPSALPTASALLQFFGTEAQQKNALGVVNLISGQYFNQLTGFTGTHGALEINSYISTLPDFTDRWWQNQFTTNNTSATLSANTKVIQAKAMYEFIEDVIANLNIDAKTSSKLSAVTFNGATYTPDSNNPGVADIGTITATINGHNCVADTDNLISLGNDYVEITLGGTDGSRAGWYVQRTSTGYKLDPGIATLSSIYTATGNYSTLSAGNKAIPVMLKNNYIGEYFPIEKGTLSTSTNGLFIIDLRPYWAYLGQDPSNYSAAYLWTVYYGAGINDLYTTANTVTTDTVNSSTYNVRFMTADVHVLTFTGTGTTLLTIPDLAEGHGMIIKIINNGPRTIKFGTNQRTLVSTAGTYSVSFFNFGTAGGGIQQVGEITNIYT